MKTPFLLAIITLLFVSCSEKKSNKNTEISGTIEGLKKGKLFIQRIKNDTLLQTIDTLVFNGDCNFKTEINLESPEMLYFFLDRGVTNSLDNNLPIFVEPGKLTLHTTLDFFTTDAKIKGSKNQELYEEYRKVISRYVDADMDLIKETFDAKKANNLQKLPKINSERDNITKKKYLYTTNFAINNGNYEIAPYITLAEIPDINLKYLDTIQKSMSAKIAKSLYGKKLNQHIEQRKLLEK